MLDFRVERILAEAVSRGEFDDLPGTGAPIPPEDNEHVPEDMRLAWRVLKNAGFFEER
jgi:hypothetical protein